MFELLFKCPVTVFTKGDFVFLSPWPAWLLVVASLSLAALLAWVAWRRRAALTRFRPAVLWLLQSTVAAVVLLLLWQPALSVATLKPRQNLIAVLVDDSRSMSIREEGRSRLERSIAALNGGVVAGLSERFRVRLYRFGGKLERIESLGQLAGVGPATRIGDALRRTITDCAGLPLGAIVLVSDGSDTSGGIDLDTIAELRRLRIPVHTAGVGAERTERDVEVVDAAAPPRALPGSRLVAQVTFRQRGYTGRQGRLTVSDNGRTLGSREITFRAEGEAQIETASFTSGTTGAKALEIAIAPLDGETNVRNNALRRLVNVDDRKPRVLYIEGEPRWEMKFIRRALEEDQTLEVVSVLRTTQNKLYRQGISDPKELEDGFPSRAEELYSFSGLVLGSVEADYFTGAQFAMIRDFVSRRGGGLLFLGGRSALSESGYGSSPLADLIPVSLAARKGTFHRTPVRAELTAAGRDSLLCRLEDDPAKNIERWRRLPALADYQETGSPKPGALVLADAVVQDKRRAALLVTQNYGRGKTAVFATGGSWRWQMLQDHKDRTHEMFWQQLLRWLVMDAPGPVLLSTPRQVLSDESRVPLRVQARDAAFSPLGDGSVEVQVVAPDGTVSEVPLRAVPQEPGAFEGDWYSPGPGSYLAETVVRQGGQEIGRDRFTFRREDGVAEDFRTEQNRELLETLAEETGGRYYRLEDLSRLGKEIIYSQAGISTREHRELWNMPAILLLLLILRGTEWVLRRKWGVI